MLGENPPDRAELHSELGYRPDRFTERHPELLEVFRRALNIERIFSMSINTCAYLAPSSSWFLHSGTPAPAGGGQHHLPGVLCAQHKGLHYSSRDSWLLGPRTTTKPWTTGTQGSPGVTNYSKIVSNFNYFLVSLPYNFWVLDLSCSCLYSQPPCRQGA